MKKQIFISLVTTYRIYFPISVILICLIGINACGSSGSSETQNEIAVVSLNEGAVDGQYNPQQTTHPVYSFSVQAGLPYTISLTDNVGSTALYVYRSNPTQNPNAELLGLSSTNSVYKTVSFIADEDTTLYAYPVGTLSTVAQFTLTATLNQLSVDGPESISFVYGPDIFGANLYYSVDLQVGTIYEVRVVPSFGDVNIAKLSTSADFLNSLGDSANTGTELESVFFTAPSTGRHYIQIDGTNIDSLFSIQVLAVPNDPEFSVVINDAISNGSDVNVLYTIYNRGASDFSGNIRMDVWANASTPPQVGTTGDAVVEHTGVVVSGLGGTLSGETSIANISENGVSYAVVDSLEAIVEADEANNVSDGIAWQKPYMVPVDFYFDDNVIPSKFTMSGHQPWIIDNTITANNSPGSLRSGAISHNQYSCAAADIYGNQSTKIAFMVHSNSDYSDWIRFYIDDELQWSWSGPWDLDTFTGSNLGNYYYTPAGVHEYKWCYEKDANGTMGEDAAWIDEITLFSVPTTPYLNITNAYSNGQEVTIEYSLVNASSIPIGAFSIEFWSNPSVLPNLGDTGETTVTYDGIASSTLISGSITIGNTDPNGTVYAIFDSQNSIYEEDESDNIKQLAWEIELPELIVTINDVVSDGTQLIIDYAINNNGNKVAENVSIEFWADLNTLPAVGDSGAVSSSSITVNPGEWIFDSIVVPAPLASGTAYALVDTGEIVLEWDENNNVSTGYSWGVSPNGSTNIDFEDEQIPPYFRMSGDLGWVIDNTQGANTSQASIRSGAITHSELSCFTVTAFNNSGVNFDYQVSTELYGDNLVFYVDGEYAFDWSGVVPWSTYYYSRPLGTHEYQWCYEKSTMVNNNDDRVWIDNIVLN